MRAEKLAEMCIRASALTVLAALFFLWGQWIWMFVAVLMIYPVALVYGLFLGITLHFVGTKQHVEDETPEIFTSADHELIVGRSEEIVGKINGLDIHEWVLLKHPTEEGTTIKCLYAYTFSTSEIDMPNNQWFVVEHGCVLYVEPETIEHAKTP